jgi:hypothetical protein
MKFALEYKSDKAYIRIFKWKVTAIPTVSPMPEPNPEDKPVKPEPEYDPARVPAEAWFRHHDYEIYWNPDIRGSFFINSVEIPIADYFWIEADGIAYGTLENINTVAGLVPRWPGATGTNTDIPVQIGGLFEIGCYLWQRGIHRETFAEFAGTTFINGKAFLDSGFEQINGHLYAAEERLEEIAAGVPVPFEPLTGRYYGQRLIDMLGWLNTPSELVHTFFSKDALDEHIKKLEIWKQAGGIESWTVENIDTSGYEQFSDVRVESFEAAGQLFDGSFVWNPSPAEMFEILIRGEI